jgi:hypothetical protein
MKTVKVYGLMSLVALAFAGSAWADQASANQNIARRAVVGQYAEQADQAWEGASLHSAVQKQQLRRQLNQQYTSKRATV